ncbi:hypothetical protein [Streptomyces minutiscleroticus]|uniref:hypothetical protein n=1 Tax=Streptomyces minutiscleroticus TaxID=68238 RepID=UPI003D9F83A2
MNGAAARVPDQVAFAVEPRLAEQMIDRAAPDLPQGRVWAAADEVYGRDGLAKSAAGMADCEVRHFHGWYRYITLYQLAAAFGGSADRRRTSWRAERAAPHRGTEVASPPSAGSSRSR